MDKLVMTQKKNRKTKYNEKWENSEGYNVNVQYLTVYIESYIKKVWKL